MKEWREPECPEKTPGDELQKIPHAKARRFKRQARLKPAQQHLWQARKADVLTVTPRVARNARTISLKTTLCSFKLLATLVHETANYVQVVFNKCLFGSLEHCSAVSKLKQITPRTSSGLF